MKINRKTVWASLLILGGIFIATTTYSRDTADSLSTALSSAYPIAHNTGSLADFPKLHPLVVHIPIMCLVLAFLSEVASFFVFKRELSWVTVVLVITGFTGAWLASGIFHGGDPNLSLLDPVSRATFEKHEQYAGYTVWLGGIAALGKIVSHFLLKRKLVYEIAVTLLLAACSYTVIVAGDMGARLVHIDGIGVQGRDIPAHDDM
ncbi:MAG: hypothetical protein JST50_06640 [Bacteroidetes bacterium]|jgi:uncharacterized membrane protein|nr:hypothetical protein [Bacteroidota bacterium]